MKPGDTVRLKHDSRYSGKVEKITVRGIWVRLNNLRTGQPMKRCVICRLGDVILAEQEKGS